MLRIKEAIVVEGKYDKIKLSQIVDGIIIDVCGFNIFRDKKKVDFIKKMADKNGIIILTDSDHAGFMIRNYLKGIISEDKIMHAYIPDIYGKEKRKSKQSKEGKLGVEGIPNEILADVLSRVSTIRSNNKSGRAITKLDFFEAGLSGGPNSVEKRKILLKKLNLPENLSQNALLKVLNEIISYDEYLKILGDINQ